MTMAHGGFHRDRDSSLLRKIPTQASDQTRTAQTAGPNGPASPSTGDSGLSKAAVLSRHYKGIVRMTSQLLRDMAAESSRHWPAQRLVARAWEWPSLGGFESSL